MVALALSQNSEMVGFGYLASIFVAFMEEWFTKVLALPFQKSTSLESIFKGEVLRQDGTLIQNEAMS